MSNKIKIDRVGLYGQKILIRWDDSHECTFGAKEIRISCQCAQCVEEWSKRLYETRSYPEIGKSWEQQLKAEIQDYRTRYGETLS